MRTSGHNQADRWQVLLLVGLGGCFAFGFVLVYYLTVRTVPGRSLADTSLRGAELTNTWLSGVVDPVLNVVSVASLLGAVATVAVIALVRLIRIHGLAAITLLVGANVSAQVLKRFLLTRPDISGSETSAHTLNSLPSGHTTAAFSAVVALLFVVPPTWRWVAAAGGGAWGTLTAVATMSAGWHRAGDSMAAFLLVGVWATVLRIAVVLLGRAEPEKAMAAPDHYRGRWPTVCAAGLMVLGGVITLVLMAEPALRSSFVGPPVAFLAGTLLIAGTAISVLLGILLALDATGPRGATGTV